MCVCERERLGGGGGGGAREIREGDTHREGKTQAVEQFKTTNVAMAAAEGDSIFNFTLNPCPAPPQTGARTCAS